MPQFQFNSQGIDPQYGGAGGLPIGKHPVVIIASALKPTKDGQGGYMELQLQAIDGPAKGLVAFDRLNLHNKSAQAVEIANKQLAAYCHVTGVFAFNATEELHNKPFVVEMKPRSDNPNQTEVGALFDINGNEPGKAGSGAPQGGQGGFGGQGGGTPPPPPQQQPQGGGAPAGGAWGGGAGGAPQGGDQGGQGGGGAPAGAGWGGGAGGAQGGGAAPAGGGGAPGWSQGQGGGAGPWGGR
jgi:hypothetical protein